MPHGGPARPVNKLVTVTNGFGKSEIHQGFQVDAD